MNVVAADSSVSALAFIAPIRRVKRSSRLSWAAAWPAQASRAAASKVGAVRSCIVSVACEWRGRNYACPSGPRAVSPAHRFGEGAERTKAPVGPGPWRRRIDEELRGCMGTTSRPAGSSRRTLPKGRQGPAGRQGTSRGGHRSTTFVGCPPKCPAAILLRLNGRICCSAACFRSPSKVPSRDGFSCRGSATGRSRDCLAGGSNAADLPGLPLVRLESGRGGTGGRDCGPAGRMDRGPHRAGRRHHRGGSGDGAAAGRDAGQVVRPGRLDGDRGGSDGFAPAADAGGGAGHLGGAGACPGATSLNGSGQQGGYTAINNPGR